MAKFKQGDIVLLLTHIQIYQIQKKDQLLSSQRTLSTNKISSFQKSHQLFVTTNLHFQLMTLILKQY